MYNSLDKQSVKQNTPIVAIGGCGQVGGHIYIVSYICITSNSTSPKSKRRA
jgi:hypothetical protein